MRDKKETGSIPGRDDLAEAAASFEDQAYPRATPETRRLLAHCRGAIRRFLASDLGRERKR